MHGWMYLLLSVACSVTVAVLLKLSRAKNIALEQMIAVNYAAAALWCWLLLNPPLGQTVQHLASGSLNAVLLMLALGVLFPSVFVIMGRAARSAGIVRADAAQRLSLFLSLLAAFWLFGERADALKWVGVGLAVAALLCLLYKERAGKGGDGMLAAAPWLLGVWIGYAVIDILLKILSKFGVAFAGTLMFSFLLALVLMMVFLLARRAVFTSEAIVAGLLLGSLNFANILFYLRAHQIYKNNPSVVFAGMNLGVIVLSTLIGLVVLKEKINSVNGVGIGLAVMAVILMFYGNQILAWLG